MIYFQLTVYRFYGSFSSKLLFQFIFLILKLFSVITRLRHCDYRIVNLPFPLGAFIVLLTNNLSVHSSAGSTVYPPYRLQKTIAPTITPVVD
ncbi:MAG: hypothetical protein H6Q17_1573 [Bacteroidetes bacterium]|nr:hypothetical protein [Bacteroidota bacterium]